MDEVKYPSSDSWHIKVLRFLNLLDDAHNALSPVKFNVWAANITTWSATLAHIVSWTAGHAGLLNDVWPFLSGWMVQAHTTHHFDKRERNLAAARVSRVSQEPAPKV